jgi:hypothetical protein
MARKAKEYIETNEMVQISDETLDAGHAVTLANEVELLAIKGGYEADRDLANQLLGQAQMALAFEEFSLTVRTSKLAFVKENKLYRALKGKKSPDGQGFLDGTWDEYCRLLGRSVAQVDEDISNVRSFGESALESMSRMGIGYRELRQYRRLPDDQKTALIEVAQSGDKNAFLDLAEDIIAKHAREKEESVKRIDDLQGELQAVQEISTEKTQRIEALQRENKRIHAAPPDQVLEELQAEATRITNDARGAIIGGLRQALVALNNQGDSRDARPTVFMAGLVGQLMTDLAALRDEFDLPTIDAAEHGWIESEVA